REAGTAHALSTRAEAARYPLSAAEGRTTRSAAGSAFVGGPICDRDLRVFVLRLSARPLAIVAAVTVLAVASPTFAQLLRPPPDPQHLQQPRKSPMPLTPRVTVTQE